MCCPQQPLCGACATPSSPVQAQQRLCGPCAAPARDPMEVWRRPEASRGVPREACFSLERRAFSQKLQGESLEPRAFRVHLPCFSLERRVFQQKLSTCEPQGCWGLHRGHAEPSWGHKVWIASGLRQISMGSHRRYTRLPWGHTGPTQGLHGVRYGSHRAFMGSHRGHTAPVWPLCRPQ